jgi:hypothetical protein
MKRHERAALRTAKSPPRPFLISIMQAAELGVERLRQPNWANPLDHIKIDIFDGKPGPWVHLYSPFNTECNGRDPVDIIITQFNCDTPALQRYFGPLPDYEEYRAAVAKFAGVLGETP